MAPAVGDEPRVKVYTRLPSGAWAITMHTGVLDYAGLGGGATGA